MLEHLYVEFGDPSCMVLRDIVRGKTKNGGEPARRPSAWVIKSSLKVSSHIKRIAATLCETHGTILTRCAGGQVFASWCMS